MLPAVQRWAETEAILQFQGFGGWRPVHYVKVAHFISVNRSENTKSNDELSDVFTLQYKLTIIQHATYMMQHG